MPTLTVEPLSSAAFAPYGDVIEIAAASEVLAINEGTALRYHDLAEVDCATAGGRTVISIFRAQPRALPLEVTMLERHPLGSQAFVPLARTRYLVVRATWSWSATAPTPRRARSSRATARA
jgi:ureidoglycolate lyase